MTTDKKAIAIKVQAKVLVKLKQLQEETGLSQAKVIEMLIMQADSLVTSTSTSKSLDTSKITSEVQALVETLVPELVQKELAKHKQITSGTTTTQREHVNKLTETEEERDLRLARETFIEIDESPPSQKFDPQMFYGNDFGDTGTNRTNEDVMKELEEIANEKEKANAKRQISKYRTI